MVSVRSATSVMRALKIWAVCSTSVRAGPGGALTLRSIISRSARGQKMRISGSLQDMRHNRKMRCMQNRHTNAVCLGDVLHIADLDQLGQLLDHVSLRVHHHELGSARIGTSLTFYQ